MKNYVYIKIFIYLFFIRWVVKKISNLIISNLQSQYSIFMFVS